MTTSNIERFDEITGKVLGALYQQFPVPVNLSAAKFVEPATRYCEIIGGEVPSKDAEFFNACVRWLADAGYLRLNQDAHFYGVVESVVLTAKGLETLKAVPKSLDGAHSIGEQLVEAAKSGMAEQVRDLTNNFLKRGYALAATTAAELINNAL